MAADWEAYLKLKSAVWASQLGLPDQAGDLYTVARAIIQGESAGNPKAFNGANANGTADYGLFQLNSNGQGKGLSVETMFDPMKNIDVGLVAVAQTWAAQVKAGASGFTAFDRTVKSTSSGHRSLFITGGDAGLQAMWKAVTGLAAAANPTNQDTGPGWPQALKLDLPTAEQAVTAGAAAAADSAGINFSTLQKVGIVTGGLIFGAVALIVGLVMIARE